MTKRDDLRPKEKLLVMDILESMGMDVSKWADMKGGARRAASNPKYCYNWSFHQPGEFIVVCFWYDGLQQRGSRLLYELKRSLKGPKRTEPGTGSDNKRANELDRYLWLAYSEQLPLRVIFVEGTHTSGKAPSVERRMLDDVSWAVVEYNVETAQCAMERGVAPVPVDISAEDAEAAGFEGAMRKRFVLHRRREGKMRRAKIEDAIAKHGTLICEVPKCGFDFEKRYGKLGEGYAQVHHLIPLKKAPPAGRPVKLSDLAIVCANCHVMIHSGGECRPLSGLIK